MMKKVFKLVLWQPDKGRNNKEGRRTTLINILLNDTGCSTTQKLSTAMMNLKRWNSKNPEAWAGVSRDKMRYFSAILSKISTKIVITRPMFLGVV